MIAIDPSHPLTVATVTQPIDFKLIEGNSPAITPAEVLEFRVDEMPDKTEAIASMAERCQEVGKHALFTVRMPEEGGKNKLSSETRLEAFDQIRSGIDGVACFFDIEVASLADNRFKKLALALSENHRVILSQHDFDKTPDINWETLREAQAEIPNSIIKLAYRLHTGLDLGKLCNGVTDMRNSGSLVAAMGMGELGPISRVTLASLGSVLNYGFLSQSNAPGQWSAAKLADILHLIKS